VWVSQGRIGYEFYCKWDDAYFLIPDDVTDPEQRILFSNKVRTWLENLYPQCAQTTPSAYIEGEFFTHSWGEAMSLLNNAEERLIEAENSNSLSLDKFISELKSMFD